MAPSRTPRGPRFLSVASLISLVVVTLTVAMPLFANPDAQTFEAADVLDGLMTEAQDRGQVPIIIGVDIGDTEMSAKLDDDPGLFVGTQSGDRQRRRVASALGAASSSVSVSPPRIFSSSSISPSRP